MTNNVTATTETTETKVKFSQTPEGRLLKPLWFVLRIYLAFVLVLTTFCAVRAFKPMDLPEAQGMTFYQFMADRAAAYKEKYNQPFVVQVLWFGFTVNSLDVPLVVSLYFPDSKLDEWVRTKGFGTIGYNYVRPRGKVEVTNFFGLLWEAVEKTSWKVFVTGLLHLRSPLLPTNK